MPLGQVEDVGIKSLILIAMHASMHLGSQACFASLAWWYYCVRIEHVAYVGLSCSKCSGRAAAEKRRPPDKAASPFPRFVICSHGRGKSCQVFSELVVARSETLRRKAESCKL